MMIRYGAYAPRISPRESRWSSSLRRTSCSWATSVTAAPAIAGPRTKRSPRIGSLGCQNWSRATIAPVASSAATMSVSSTEM